MNPVISFDIVVAVDAGGGIGRNGDLPWHLPEDLAFFKRLTTETTEPDQENCVIMGRKTWESIPPRYRPLPRRRNIVLTRNRSFSAPEADLVTGDLDQALDDAADQPRTARIFVVGGAQVYGLALAHPGCRNIYLTRIEEDFDCDTFFPDFADHYMESERSEERREGSVCYRFLVFRRK